MERDSIRRRSKGVWSSNELISLSNSRMNQNRPSKTSSSNWEGIDPSADANNASEQQKRRSGSSLSEPGSEGNGGSSIGKAASRESSTLSIDGSDSNSSKEKDVTLRKSTQSFVNLLDEKPVKYGAMAILKKENKKKIASEKRDFSNSTRRREIEYTTRFSFAAFHENTFVPPKYYNNIQGQPRRRSIFERIYLITAVPGASQLSLIYAIVFLFLIVFSIIFTTLETLPESREYRPGCEQCAPIDFSGDVNVTLVTMRESLADVCSECRPRLLLWLQEADIVFVVLFTLDYVVRLLTVWDVPMEIIDSDKLEAKDTKMNRLWVFVKDGFNIVDVLCVLPFYFDLFLDDDGSSENSALLVLRALRVLRIMKLWRQSKSFVILSDKVLIIQSSLLSGLGPMCVLLVYSAFAMVVSASIIFVFEQGKWDPATGRYMVQDRYYLDVKQPSRFDSIPETFWWVLSTFSTCGFGTSYPLTDEGKAVGALLMYVGLMFYSVPIAVIGKKFTVLYERSMAKAEKIMSRRNAVLYRSLVISTLDALARTFRLWREWASSLASSKDSYSVDSLRILTVREMLALKEVLGKTIDTDTLRKARMRRVVRRHVESAFRVGMADLREKLIDAARDVACEVSGSARQSKAVVQSAAPD